MKVIINKSTIGGSIIVPPSKSYAHRLLILAGLSGSEITVNNLDFSQDIKATLSSLKSLGVNFTEQEKSVTFLAKKENLCVKAPLNCFESGSTLRFFIPIALALSDSATFVGTEKLISRGIKVYEELFKDKGITFDINKETITASGRLKSGTFNVSGGVSSQFITGLMFGAMLLNNDSQINVIPPIESQSYIHITLDALNSFGVNASKIAENSYFIKGNQKPRKSEVSVEGDWSNGAFLLALNYIGAKVSVEGLNDSSKQGDKAVVQIFEKISKGYCEIDLSDVPDLAPICFAMASLYKGARFTGTRRLKIKESDRANSMKEELKKFGVSVTVGENFVDIKDPKIQAPTEVLYGHNDHRIVMALSVLSLINGGSIDGAEAINKSYPKFFEDLMSLGAEINYE